MADQLGSAVLTLSVDDKQFIAGLSQAQRAAEGAASGLKTALAGLGVATTVGGIAGFIGSQVTQLDAASAAVRTLGVDSGELGTRLRALSIELGNNISTVELTKAAYDVASSGFSSAADATSILRASALGAKGGFAEVNDVASALTGVLNAYGLSASEAGRIVDQFVQTQADGVITVRQYAAEIGNVASIAAASGIKIEELNAAIATATLRGVPVAQTFTGLRQAISSIIKPSQQAAELASSLGIQFDVNALQAKGFGGVLADVQAKTGGAADKIAILLGSVEAQAAVQPLLNDKLIKYNELLEKQATAAGAAADASSINATTISGGLKQIGAGFSNLATTLDTALTPLFAGFIKSINDILIKLNQVSALSPDKVQKREQEATAAVEAQSNPLQRTGFAGGVEVKYLGKTFKGTAAGVREAIIQELLKKDLQAINTPAKTVLTPQKSSSLINDKKQPQNLLEPQSSAADRRLVAGSEKTKQNLIDAYDAAARSAERIAESAAKAKVDLLEAQASPDKGLNRFLTGDQIAVRRQDSVRELAPFVENAIRDASGILSRQNLRLAPELIGQLRQTTQLQERRVVGEINGRQLFAGPETVSQPALQTQLDFIRAVQEEKAGITSARDAQIELATSLKELAQKQWLVEVNVNSDGNSYVYGDIVNQAVTQ